MATITCLILRGTKKTFYSAKVSYILNHQRVASRATKARDASEFPLSTLQRGIGRQKSQPDLLRRVLCLPETRPRRFRAQQRSYAAFLPSDRESDP